MSDRLNSINELLTDSAFDRVGVLTNDDARWLVSELFRLRTELRRVGVVAAGALAERHNAIEAQR
jgi:hypothetical protein